MHSTDDAVRVAGAHAEVVAPADPPPPGAVGAGMPAALVVATAASATAGLVHAVAAGSHSADRTLAWLFAACAVVQLTWAGVAALRPTRPVLVAGALFNLGAVGVWGLTRTVGIGLVDALAEPEAVTTPDLTAALLAGASVLGVASLLGAPARLPRLSPVWAGMLGAVVLATGAPAMTAGHTHGGHDHGGGEAHAHGDDGHDHGDGPDHLHGDGALPHEHGDGEDHDHADGAAHDHGAGDDHAHGPGDQGHDHGAGGDHAHGPGDQGHDHGAGGDHAHGAGDQGHDHGAGGDHAHPHDPGDPTHPHDPGDPDHPHDPDDPDDPDHPHVPDGPIISVDDPRITDEQRAAAVALIDVTRAGMARFTDVASVLAAGYTSIGDASTGYEHFVNFGFLNDPYILDPDRIESVVFEVQPDGTKVLVSGMYILRQGMTMADVPDIAGELTTWHDHQDLCWSLDSGGNPIVVGIRPPGGSCPFGSVFVATPPMLHVWLVEHPCGPFAGIETDGAQGPHGTSCLHEH